MLSTERGAARGDSTTVRAAGAGDGRALSVSVSRRLRWIRLTALVAAVEAQASPVKPASGWSAIRAWPWSRRVGSSSDASGLLFPTAVAPHGDVDYGLRGAQHRWLTW